MEINIEEIKSKMTSDYFIQELRTQLELAIIVDLNYEHIVHLEQLKSVFKSGLGNYYKQYHPELEYFTLVIAQLIENTRANHYKREGQKLLPSVHSVYFELFNKHFKLRSQNRKPIL